MGFPRARADGNNSTGAGGSRHKQRTTMAHTNESNPVNDPIALEVSQVQETNRNHREMKGRIKRAAEGNAAMEQVMAAQYATRVSNLRFAFLRVLDYQSRITDLSLIAGPQSAFDELKDELGL